METQLIHIRLDKKFKEAIETQARENHYTLTEFVKEALRQRLQVLAKEKLEQGDIQGFIAEHKKWQELLPKTQTPQEMQKSIAALRSLQGSVKNVRRITREERKEVADKLFEELRRNQNQS